jgi:beta-glucosidase
LNYSFAFFRGPSIWDNFVKIQGKIHNGDTGDVAANSYNLYHKDIELMRNLGVNSYRFSISWSRLLPQGRGEVNSLGVEYYNNLINSLLEANIQPIVTLYHWDMPQALQDEYDGLLDERFIEDFAAYSRLCFSLFGDRVKKWITFNEPWSICYTGYGSYKGTFAPGRCSNRAECAAGNSTTEPYLAAHILLRAHALASEIYTKDFKYIHYPAGLLGITLNMDWAEPLVSTRADHLEAAERRREFQLGWFLFPLLTGEYPLSMKKLVGKDMQHYIYIYI